MQGIQMAEEPVETERFPGVDLHLGHPLGIPVNLSRRVF